MEILKAIVTTTTIRIMLLKFLGIKLGICEAFGVSRYSLRITHIDYSASKLDIVISRRSQAASPRPNPQI